MAGETGTTYLTVESVDQAWQVLQDNGKRARPLWVSPQPPDLTETTVDVWVDLSQLSTTAIEQAGSALTVGAGVSLRQLMEAEAASQLFAGLLSKAIRKTAHHGLRNLATVGAVLQDPKSAPEFSAALLACDPNLLLFDGVERTVPLAEFWRGGAEQGLPLRLEFELEPATAGASSLHWVGRSPMDKAIVAAACTAAVEADSLTWLKLSLAGDGFWVQRLSQLETELEGNEPNSVDGAKLEAAARQALTPEASFRASGAYQKHLIGVLARRAVMDALAEVS